jgi:hypothetical protein
MELVEIAGDTDRHHLSSETMGFRDKRRYMPHNSQDPKKESR